MTQEKEEAYLQVLEQSVLAGEETLKANGTAVDMLISMIFMDEGRPLWQSGEYESEAARNADGSLIYAGWSEALNLKFIDDLS